MKKELILSKAGVAAFLLVLAGAFYAINVDTPFINDDYWLNFVMKMLPDGSLLLTDRRIASWGDIWESWCAHRLFVWNGRVSDYLVSIAVMLGGKALFNVLSTLFMLANVLLLSKLCFRQVSLWSVCIVSAAFILFVPGIDATVFWMAGACNYFWGSALVSAFLLCLRALAERTERLPIWLVALGSLFGFSCGALHEGLGVPLAGGLVMFGVVERWLGRKMPCYYWLLVICVIAGSLIPVSAPAAWRRAGGAAELSPSVRDIAHTLYGMAYRMAYFGGIAWLFFIVAFLRNKKAIHSPIGWFLVALIGITFIVSKNSWAGFYYYMVIAMLIFFLSETAGWWKRHAKAATCVCLPLVGGAVAYECFFMADVGRAYQEVIDAPKEDGVCMVDDSWYQGKLPYVLSQALPQCRSHNIYIHFGKMFNQENFWVYRRNTKLDKTVYSLFQGEVQSEPQIRRWNGQYVLRLPEYSWCRQVECRIADKKLIFSRKEARSSWPIFSSRRKDGNTRNYEEDFHKGCRYLLLPPEANGYAHISFTAIQDPPYNPVRKRSTFEETPSRKYCLPLPKDESRQEP